MLNRGGGKTFQMLTEAHGRKGIIVCRDQAAADRLAKQAKELGLDINPPITAPEFTERFCVPRKPTVHKQFELRRFSLDSNLPVDDSYKQRLIDINPPGSEWYRRLIEGNWINKEENDNDK